MGYKYFSLLFNYISSSFQHNLAYALLQGRIRLRWGFCSRPSHSHNHVSRETGGNQPHSVFMGRLMPGELKQGLPSKKEPHEGRGDTSCPYPPRRQHAIINACMHNWCLWLLIMVFLFLSRSIFETVTQISCTSTQSSLSVLCGVISSFTNCYICMSCRIWFCEPLNFHYNKFLLWKYFI